MRTNNCRVANTAKASLGRTGQRANKVLRGWFTCKRCGQTMVVNKAATHVEKCKHA
jgi:hypothetical protein